MNIVIQAHNISKYFKEVRAVHELSFTVNSGQVYGFLGQNGAGKSTTIRMMLTLIRPDSGHIEIFGLDLQKHRKEILRNVGAIIEKPDLYKYLTAKENLRIVAALSGKKIPAKKIMEQLAMVGLADRANSRVKTYSQGMKQRLGIATALVHDPQLIILDEPMNGLDPQGIADIRNLITHLSKDLGKTIFVSSHLLNEMELIADSMLIINQGKKLAEGTKDELLNPAKTQVELITDNPESSVTAIRNSKWGQYLFSNGNDNGNILLQIEKMQIPAFNRDLVALGINVISLRPKHSLEDYFLSLTTH